MENIDRRARARRAIQQLAFQLDLPQDLQLLSERWNTVAKLGDSGVIAKAATLADLVISNPLHSFTTEVEICRKLSGKGAPVHVPYQNGIYEIDGIPITLWHEVDGEMGEVSEAELVDSLAVIHRLGGNLLGENRWFSTVTTHFEDVMPRLEERRVVDQGVLQALDSHYQRQMDIVSSARLTNSFIHGDAQRKNAMSTDTGAIWIDFEECSYGPLAWDLACLTMNRRFDTDRVLDRYAAVSGMDRIENSHIDTLKQLRDLEAVTWMLAIQHERKPEFAKDAAELLATVLQAATGD